MSATPRGSCAAVIVAYNNEETIRTCLESVFSFSPSGTAAVVVDNSPGDGTSLAVEACRSANPEFDVTLIRRPDNIGFAAGCNLGAGGRTEEYLLFLNPDARLDNDVATALTGFLEEREGAALVGPQIRDERGAVTRTCRNLPTPFRIFCDATRLDVLLGRYRLLRFDHRETRAVDQIIGACMAVRRADFEALGGFDERFFIYYEEVDFCKRVLESGGGVWFFPKAIVTHQAGTSCEAPAALDRMPGYMRRSRSQYFAKHFGLVPQFLVLAITLAESVLKAAALAAPALGTSHRAAYRRARRNGFLAILREWRQPPRTDVSLREKDGAP